jgi:thiol-disulfide isomerase/thioredoxin
VVDFAAPAWCGPCIKFSPHFKAAAERSDATFVHIDVDVADADLVQEYNILGVPTVLGFVNDKLTATIESRTAIPLLREIEAL